MIIIIKKNILTDYGMLSLLISQVHHFRCNIPIAKVIAILNELQLSTSQLKLAVFGHLINYNYFFNYPSLLATLLQGIQEPSVVKDKVGEPRGDLV